MLGLEGRTRLGVLPIFFTMHCQYNYRYKQAVGVLLLQGTYCYYNVCFTGFSWVLGSRGATPPLRGRREDLTNSLEPGQGGPSSRGGRRLLQTTYPGWC